ncbi:unnamed protein product [Ranitomeya imitator]|uniref:Uncharacterized protein n=1 Tax=Ranitomeya imitator TaxID=111125 RepID=A0ABN9MKK2_9NEOB|nr:unnamed protein product [Ranitomeya imitator]
MKIGGAGQQRDRPWHHELQDRVTSSETKVSEMERSIEDLQWDIEKLRKHEQKLKPPPGGGPGAAEFWTPHLWKFRKFPGRTDDSDCTEGNGVLSGYV